MSRRSGLGRGLDALLPRGGDGDLEERDPLRRVRLDAIRPNPRQPRRAFDEAGLEELAASIAEVGVLQPILVRSADGGYELVAGERRLRAAQRAGLDQVPVMVVETDEGGSLERTLVENLHRSNLNPIEEASGYRELMRETGLSQDELAGKLHRDRSTIAHSLRLLDLPSSIQRLLIEGRLSGGHGRALHALNGHPFQERATQRAVGEGQSVRDTEAMIRDYLSMTGEAPPRSRSRARSLPPEAAEAQRKLAGHLQSRVRVEVGKRKGKIVVDFVSLEELDRIVTAIVGDQERTQQVVAP
jgi:ParB family transcriptional regulator, chromosome partitioning protein